LWSFPGNFLWLYRAIPRRPILLKSRAARAELIDLCRETKALPKRGGAKDFNRLERRFT
jgi:hypothetical protein